MLLETSLPEFHEKFYITEMQKLELCLPRVYILGTHNCVKELREKFKCRGNLHDVLCWSEYSEWVVSVFSFLIQP